MKWVWKAVSSFKVESAELVTCDGRIGFPSHAQILPLSSLGQQTDTTCYASVFPFYLAELSQIQESVFQVLEFGACAYSFTV